MTIYFSADTHFNHANIIKYCNRPFSSVEEMNEALIEKWNNKVKDNDQIYILGDLIFGNGLQANDILNKLNGKKFFIKGNHDPFLKDKNFNRSLLEWIKDYYVLKVNKQKIVLFHYPIAEWDGKFHGSIHLYGHVHNNPFPYELGRTYNVGVDVNNFEPVSLEEILERIEKSDVDNS